MSGDPTAVLQLKILRGVTIVAIVLLACFLWLHATLTEGWKEDLIDVAPVMLLLILAVVGLTRALRRETKKAHGL
jgi:CHASE2 domain-containing sensor protein